jgi:hypothetical protein
MMECLLAVMADMKGSQEYTVAKMDAWLEETKAWWKETTARQEAKEGYPERSRATPVDMANSSTPGDYTKRLH